MSWLPAPYDFTATGWRGIVELSTELEFLVLVGKSPEQSWQADQNTNNRCDLVKKWWKPWVLDVVFLSIIILYAIRVYLSGGRG